MQHGKPVAHMSAPSYGGNSVPYATGPTQLQAQLPTGLGGSLTFPLGGAVPRSSGSLTIPLGGAVPRSDSIVRASEPGAMQRSPSMVRTSNQQDVIYQSGAPVFNGAMQRSSSMLRTATQQDLLLSQGGGGTCQFVPTAVPGTMQRSSSMVRTSAQQESLTPQLSMPVLPTQECPSTVPQALLANLAPMQCPPTLLRTSWEQELKLVSSLQVPHSLQSYQRSKSPVRPKSPVRTAPDLRRSVQSGPSSTPQFQRSTSPIRTPPDMMVPPTGTALSIRQAMQIERMVSQAALPTTPSKFDATEATAPAIQYIFHEPHAPGQPRSRRSTVPRNLQHPAAAMDRSPRRTHHDALIGSMRAHQGPSPRQTAQPAKSVSRQTLNEVVRSQTPVRRQRRV